MDAFPLRSAFKRAARGRKWCLRRCWSSTMSKIVLNSVKRVLGEAGFDVETTTSGRQGLEWALGKAYDLVITDIRMPDVGGMIILKDVKRARPEVLW
jgi:DNA-binding NarL/FixJ family response regulator